MEVFNIEKIVFDRQAAAEALDISLPTLDGYINREHNPIPVLRVGRHIKIPVEALRNWVREETKRQDSARCSKVGD